MGVGTESVLRGSGEWISASLLGADVGSTSSERSPGYGANSSQDPPWLRILFGIGVGFFLVARGLVLVDPGWWYESESVGVNLDDCVRVVFVSNVGVMAFSACDGLWPVPDGGKAFPDCGVLAFLARDGVWPVSDGGKTFLDSGVLVDRYLGA